MYLEFEIWCEKKLTEPGEIKLQRSVQIAELFDQAESMVTENIERVIDLKTSYYSSAVRKDDAAYLTMLHKFADSESSRPFALVLQYYYYAAKDDLEQCDKVAEHLTSHQMHDSVAAVLFRHFGRNLQVPNNRTRLWQFLQSHPEIREKNPIRYYFDLSILDAYDRRFTDSRLSVKRLTENFRYFNRRLSETWLHPDTSEPEVFESLVETTRGRKSAHVFDLQQNFPIRHTKSAPEVKVGDRCTVVLKFFPYGIVAFVQDVMKPIPD